MENWRKLSHNYNQILPLNNSSQYRPTSNCPLGRLTWVGTLCSVSVFRVNTVFPVFDSGFLVFWLQIAIEPFVLFHQCFGLYVFHRKIEIRLFQCILLGEFILSKMGYKSSLWIWNILIWGKIKKKKIPCVWRLTTDKSYIQIFFFTMNKLLHRRNPGPSCSKLAMSWVNVSIKTLIVNMAYMLIFLLKKCE